MSSNGSIKMIACPLVLEEARPFLAGVDTETLDAGLHRTPETLRAALQNAIDATDERYDRIILGYGLCSSAVVGLTARSAALIIPRVDDCIAISLGSQKAYRAQARKEPGSYYLTREWIKAGITPFAESSRMVERWGEERADKLMRRLLKGYRRLVFIRTAGSEDLEPSLVWSREMADRYGLTLEILEGSSALAEKIAKGPWDWEFVKVLPGETVSCDAFLGE